MKKKIFFFLFTSIFIASCSTQNTQLPNSGKLQVVATTSIVGDVVRQVGGEFIDVKILLPEGSDPHSFDPSPRDIAMVADADIVFANGAGLETFIVHLLESAEAEDRVVEVSEGIILLTHPKAEGQEQAQNTGDPHTWVDPNNVIIWVQNIELALSEMDPPNKTAYATNAAFYTSQLVEIDAWIRAEIAKIPAEKRKIVTDHRLLGYYVEEYGLEQVGAIVEGYSSLAEPSAQELAEIEEVISGLGVPAIFVGNTVNSNLAERVAEDTGVKIIYFYTGSLSEADGEAGNYLDYLRYNTRAFVDALK